MSEVYQAVPQRNSEEFALERKMLGQQLLLWRTYRGLSKRKLSRKAGLNISRVVDLEQGKSFPTMPTALRLCKALEINLFQLLYVYPASNQTMMAHDQPYSTKATG